MNENDGGTFSRKLNQRNQRNKVFFSHFAITVQSAKTEDGGYIDEQSQVRAHIRLT